MSSTTKRILVIVVIALIVVGGLLLLWLWYLNKQASQTSESSGNSGTSANVAVSPNQSSAGYTSGVTVGSSTAPSSGGLAQSGNGIYQSPSYSAGGGASSGVGSPTYTIPSNPYVSFVPATTTAVGAQWIPGGGTPFNPTPINTINSSNPAGSGSIFHPTNNGSTINNGTGSLSLLLAGVGVSAAACSGVLGEIAAAQTGGVAAGALTAIPKVAELEAIPKVALTVPVSDASAELNLTTISTLKASSNALQVSNTTRDDFLSCMARYAARIALQQITASVVNWIDTGFQGSPTFVQNYQQFFANVANQAAGAYLQGSSLAFLCSPFQLQIKIAVAQAYANANAVQTSCTLTQVSNNIQNFINGDFSQGGWAALLSFTGAPANNPFGAYLVASGGLANALGIAQQNAAQNISPEGFLNMQQISCPAIQTQAYQLPGNTFQGTGLNGSVVPGSYVPASVTNSATFSANTGTSCPLTPQQQQEGCTCKTTTPGSVIAASLNKQLGVPTDELNAAQNFDQIISALMTQLLSKGLQGGISNLAGQNGYQSNFLTPGQQQAATDAQTLLQQLQNSTFIAQEDGGIQQNDITNIQNAQGQLQTLVNCWGSAASSTTFSTAQQTEAASNEAAAQAQIDSLQTQVDSYNNQITQINSSIATLEQLQTQVLNASSDSSVQNAQNTFNSDQASGLILTNTDLATAQADESTLQTQMATLDQNTSTQLEQCYAF